MTINMKKIRPVLRLKGSKYKLMPTILELFSLSKKDIFIEPFGGTGIVSVNLKANLPKTQVILNDFDNIFPLSKEFVIKNLTSYEGQGLYQTKKAVDYFHKRVKNNLWSKVDKYNQIIDQIKVIHKDFRDIQYPKNSFIFFDPPYKDRKKLYKKYVSLKDLKDFIDTLDSSIQWIITYNLCEDVFKHFNYQNIFIYKTKNKNTKNGEILISNFQISFNQFDKKENCYINLNASMKFSDFVNHKIK